MTSSIEQVGDFVLTFGNETCLACAWKTINDALNMA